MASAEACLAWLLCPYVAVNGLPDTRKLSLASVALPDGVTWVGDGQIDIDGEGSNQRGQALVCLSGENRHKRAAEQAGTGAGCEVIPRGQVGKRMTRPKAAYFDTSTQTIKFLDGKGGRPLEHEDLSIPRGISDPVALGVDRAKGSATPKQGAR